MLVDYPLTHKLLNMHTIELEPGINQRLNKLAEQTGRSVTEITSRALEEYLEDLEDTMVARERLENPDKTYSLEETKRELGIGV